MEQELKEILLSMQSELKAMKEAQEQTNARLDTIEADIAELKEDAAVTRSGVNTLLDWAEKAQVQVKIPLFQKAE